MNWIANRLHCKHDNVHNCKFVTRFMIWRFCALISISVYWPTCWLLNRWLKKVRAVGELCRRCHLRKLTVHLSNKGITVKYCYYKWTAAFWVFILKPPKASFFFFSWKSALASLILWKHKGSELWLESRGLWVTFYKLKMDASAQDKRGWQRRFREQQVQVFQRGDNGTPLSCSSWWPACWPSSTMSCWSSRWQRTISSSSSQQAKLSSVWFHIWSRVPPQQTHTRCCPTATRRAGSGGFADPVVATSSAAVAVLQQGDGGEGWGRFGLVWFRRMLRKRKGTIIARVQRIWIFPVIGDWLSWTLKAICEMNWIGHHEKLSRPPPHPPSLSFRPK